MAWSSFPAAAPASPILPVSEVVIDAALNEAAEVLRYGNADLAVARVGELVPDLVASPERCVLAGLILLAAGATVGRSSWFDRARELRPDLLAGPGPCRLRAARARPSR